MGKNGSNWQTVSITPLSGGLDTRSIPADIPPGWFRWKLNARVTPEGKLGRMPGFSRAWADALYDDAGLPLTDPNSGAGINYHNHDHHHVGAAREPITFLQEITWGDKTRQLFDGTETRISVLDETTGAWTDVVTGKGSYGSYWTAAFLQDTIIFTNDTNNILAYPMGGPAAEIPDLRDTVQCTAARIAIEFQGCVFLMNTIEVPEGGGAPQRFASRVRWCDLNLPLSWNLAAPGTAAGYQDLDYGDEILAAGLLLGKLYIYTRRKIWRVAVADTTDVAFTFEEVYSEPKNQTGCLSYPRTLVSSGNAHFYASRDGLYKYSPFIAAPERVEWLHRASGVMFSKADTKMSGVICNSPVAEYRPETNEVWFSWPIGNYVVNNLSLVAQLDHETASVVDHGFTAFVNFRRVPLTAILCNEVQSFIGASGTDYCLKDLGNVFSRDFVLLGTNGEGYEDPTVDLDDVLTSADYYSEGYYTVLRGLVPTGYFDREKYIRNVLLEHTTAEEATPCNMRLRLGNAYHYADPNDETARCSVQWRDVGIRELACANIKTIAQMTAQNLRPSNGMEWPTFVQGRFVYYEFRVQSPTATEALGADSWWQRIDFSVQAGVA